MKIREWGRMVEWDDWGTLFGSWRVMPVVPSRDASDT